MKVWVVIDDDELESRKAIQGICLTRESADVLWRDFRSDRFHYVIKEYEVIE